MARIKCDMCEGVINTERFDRPLNELQGATFVLSDNSTITVCRECLERAAEDREFVNEFLEMRERIL
jgi:hypothetical protein